MNNIQDNPARVAPPEPPAKINIDAIKYDLLDAYLDSDINDGTLHQELEDYIIESGLIHHWLRKMYTREHDEVQLDMQDLLKSFVSDYVDRTL
tara:strand:- start:177 stop:455 length:279 start_codon:yes stop_codon:yes gene_type:complete